MWLKSRGIHSHLDSIVEAVAEKVMWCPADRAVCRAHKASIVHLYFISNKNSIFFMLKPAKLCTVPPILLRYYLLNILHPFLACYTLRLIISYCTLRHCFFRWMWWCQEVTWRRNLRPGNKTARFSSVVPLCRFSSVVPLLSWHSAAYILRCKALTSAYIFIG